MTEKINFEKDTLHIEEIPAAELAEKHGTPLYVYSAGQITKNFKELEKAFGIIPKARILYALKANSNPEILRHISKLGAGADTVSAGEIFLALRSGFPAVSISLAGVGKTDRDIDFALTRGIGTIIVESNEELKVVSERATALGRSARVALRINPDVDARTHPHISTGLKENKFGINIDKAAETARRAAKMKNVELVGIHSHIGSQVTEHTPFEEAAESIRRFVLDLKNDGIKISQIDVGGGIGVRYRNAIRHKLLPVEKKEEPLIDLNALAKVIKEKLSFPGCEIAIEPGRFIVAESGILLTRVLYRKESAGRTFIVVDAGMNDMMRHALYSAYHQIVPVELKDSEFAPVDVVGPVCETTDAFAVQRDLPSLGRGDLVAIMTAGAYGYSIASNYNSRPKPAEILVEKDSARVVRDRETLEDLI
jgi:diaminopimelate decarboxylase